jgi:CubicO group peptidase (beta-lactamase class C family)
MRLLSLLVAFFLTLPLAAQERRFDAKAVDRIVNDTMRAWQLPGVAVAIVRNDRVVFVGGYGTTGIESGEPVTADTLFQIGSTSKAFTSAAVAMLVDEKKVSWDDPVRKQLDYFRLADLCADSQVTVRDILAHRTGLGRHDELWDNSPWSREEVVRKAGRLNAAREFRSAYQYQNIMYIAAGEVVANASGVSWDEFVRTRIFQPLGMSRTTISDQEWERSPHAIGHRYDSKTGRTWVQPPIETATLGAAGAIKSTARDMAHWIRFQLADGAFGQNQLVSPESLSETKTPQTIVRMQPSTRESNPETHLMSYGLGWIIQDYRGEFLVSHAGALNGFRTHVDLLPKRNAGFVVMTNSGRGIALIALRNALADLITGKAGRDWNAYYLMIDRKAQDREEASRQERLSKRHSDTTPSHPLEAFTGTFESDSHGIATISLDSSGLVFRWSRMAIPLVHFHYDVFLAESEADWVDEQVAFGTGGDGTIDSLTIFGQRFRRVNR